MNEPSMLLVNVKETIQRLFKRKPHFDNSYFSEAEAYLRKLKKDNSAIMILATSLSYCLKNDVVNSNDADIASSFLFQLAQKENLEFETFENQINSIKKKGHRTNE